MSTTTADIVVAGAGHNSLITAAYLACAGREVVVLDARPVPGGGATTGPGGRDSVMIAAPLSPCAGTRSAVADGSR